MQLRADTFTRVNEYLNTFEQAQLIEFVPGNMGLLDHLWNTNRRFISIQL